MCFVAAVPEFYNSRNVDALVCRNLAEEGECRNLKDMRIRCSLGE